MQDIGSKIEVEARGIRSTFSPLINSIFNRGENQMTSKSISKVCSVDGCESKHFCRGWCRLHHGRWRRHGDPLKTLTHFGTGRTREEQFWSKVQISTNVDECWEWQGSLTNGYGSTRYQGNVIAAHRLAWLFIYGELPADGRVVRHHCDNPKCVNPNHLAEGTHKQNSQDRGSRNRTAIGERAGRALLTEAQVLEIRRRCTKRGDRSSRGENTRVHLAREFNVGRTTIAAIVNNQSWRHLKHCD